MRKDPKKLFDNHTKKLLQERERQNEQLRRAFLEKDDLQHQNKLVEKFPYCEDGIKKAFQALEKNDPKGLRDGIDLIMKSNLDHSIEFMTQGARNKADEFAKKIKPKLDEVRSEGYDTVRSIADRFNELQVPTRQAGSKWDGSRIYQIIKRLRDLELE